MSHRLARSTLIFLSLALALPQASEAAISRAPRVAAPSAIVAAQFVYGGDPFCWFEDGWNGPGWYRCAYGPWEKGYWWGGAYGWNGWRGGHPGPRLGQGGPNPPPRVNTAPPPRVQAQPRLQQQPHPHPQGHAERR